MIFETWIAFTASSAAFLLFPVGPTILLVVTLGMSNGPRIAPAAASGVALGDFTAMTVSLAGLGALIMASAQAFAVFKWIAAAYLIWLGIRTIRSARDAGDNASESHSTTSSLRAFFHCAGVTALNPKPIAFFVAFVPHFIDPAAPIMPQFAAVIATFTCLAWLNAFLYARLAGRLGGVIRRPSILAWFKRVSGTILIGMGLTTAALRRSSV